MPRKKKPALPPKKYSVELHQEAQEQFDRLTKKHQRQARDRILRLEDDPRPKNAVRLADHKDGPIWRVRFGDYFRLVYQIRDSKLVVLVLMIGDRKSVYKELGRRKLI